MRYRHPIRFGLIAGFFFSAPAIAQNAWQLDTWLIPPPPNGALPGLGAISPAGTAAAGDTWIRIDDVDYRAIWVWTESGGFNVYQKTQVDEATTGTSYEVIAVADDGLTVVGNDGSATHIGQGTPLQNMRAWKWTPAAGFTALPDHPNGEGETLAISMSADGSTIIGTAFDDDPNYDVYDENVYAVSWVDEKSRRNVRWQSGAPTNLSPYYDSTRRTPYVGQAGFEELAWKRVFWIAPQWDHRSLDGGATIAVGSKTEYAGSAHPDWDNGGAENVAGAFVSPIGSQETANGPYAGAGGSVWNTVSSDGNAQAGREVVRSSTSQPITSIDIIRKTPESGITTAVSLDPITYTHMQAQSVSSDGEWILLNTGSAALHLWNSGYGFVDLNSWIQNDLCVVADPGFYAYADRIVGDRPVIMGRAATSLGVAVFRLQQVQGDDTDEDGLLDTWEINGLDINEDGIIDLDLPAMGADPYRKDIFLEVDVMRNVAWSGAAFDKVIAAFDDAPVQNFDDEGIAQQDGIILHIDYATIETVRRTRVSDDQFILFQSLKNDHFGTEDERASSNWAAIKCAREAVFRYCIVVDEIADPNGNTTGGLGERPGNDFMVSSSAVENAADFDYALGRVVMHELGHTLDLQHGGADSINFKPNYVSVMNYGFQTATDQINPQVALDYSREKLADLFESALNEQAGIDSTHSRGIAMIHGYHIPGSSPSMGNVQLDGRPTDFDQVNGIYSPAIVDLNWLTDAFPTQNSPSPGETLKGHDDWANIKIPLGTGGAYAQSVAQAPAEKELSIDFLQWVQANAPPPPPPYCEGDFNLDDIVDGADLAALLAAWGTANEATDFNGDGITDGADLAQLLAAWGACP